MVLRTRGRVWIISARRLAKVLKSRCQGCKILAKMTAGQLMAPLPAHRVGPTPAFYSTAVDLFGPLEYQGTVNKRSTGKGWGAIFVCTASSAVHIELVETYSTDSFLQALRRFTCIRGQPQRFQSDAGLQLEAAGQQIASWDYSEVVEWCNSKNIEWQVMPTGAQHFNGQAERLIGMLKRSLTQVMAGKRCSYGELTTVLAEAAQMVNTRPLGALTDEPEAGNPLTPLHLLLGRATIEVPRVQHEEKAGLVKRMKFVEEIKKEFWKKWLVNVFSERTLQRRWRKEERDMRTGDVVLMKDETAASERYRMGRITKVKQGEDGHVRSAEVTYKNPGEAVFRSSWRPIHNLVLLVPEASETDEGETAQEKEAKEAQDMEV